MFTERLKTNGTAIKITRETTNNQQKKYKRPLDIFSLQIDRKGSKEYLVMILAVKESFERFSCLEFIFEKSKHRRGKPA